jgi:hypothetical protein
MQRINNRVILPFLTVLLGGVWVIIGLGQYDWYADGKPGSGFFPTITGALLLLMSILAIVSESKLETPKFRIFHFYPIITAVGIVLFAMLIGFFPALTLYVFGWLKWYEKYNLKTTILTTILTIAGMYGVFSMWLRVPFPMGFFLEGILR